VGTVLSGGNIDLRAIADVAMRELARSGHLLRVDVPGRTIAPAGDAELVRKGRWSVDSSRHRPRANPAYRVVDSRICSVFRSEWKSSA
jgi:hypothetical protein